jgi:serine protease
MSIERDTTKRRGWIWVLVILLVLLVWWWWRPAPDNGRHVVDDLDVAVAVDESDPDDILVDFQDDLADAEVAALERELGIDLVLVSNHSHDEQFYRAHVDPARRDALLARLSSDARVETAEPDAVYGLDFCCPNTPTCPGDCEGARTFNSSDFDASFARPKFSMDRFSTKAVVDTTDPAYRNYPNDPLYKHQWHMAQIGMPRAWPLAETDGVIVAVIDTGVAYEDWQKFHMVPDLAGVKFTHGYDFVGNNPHGVDDHGHGTHVAGTIAQATNNGLGVAGVAPGVTIMPLKVLGARGSGSVAGIADAIRYAADNGAKVINMSLGGRMRSAVLARAVKYAHDKGVTVICAAGNDGQDRVSYPAAYEGAVAIAATQFDETTTFYSNRGKEIDVAAPGGNTRVDQNGDGMPDGVLQNTIVVGDPTKDGYFPFMGTSMASPHAAGVAALIVGAGVTEPDAVEKILKDSARAPKAGKLEANRYGAGIIDAPGAIKAAKNQQSAGQLGLGLALAAAVAFAARRRAGASTLGLGYGVGALAGSAGLLFFLPMLGDLGARLASLPGLGALTHGLPSMGMDVFGPTAFANPLTFGALLPLALIGFGLGVARLRPLLAGLAAGVAAHLTFHAVAGVTDVRFMVADGAWLLVNAAILTVAAVLTLRAHQK